MRSSSSNLRNTGLSRIPSRIHSPIPTSTIDSRKGMRQPQVRNAVARQRAENQHRDVGQEQTGRHAKLRPGRDEAPVLVAARPLHRHQHGAAPLAAHADPLDEAQRRQDHRAPDADAVIGRHQPDQERGNAHQHQRGDQRRFAAEPVAPMAEDRGPTGRAMKPTA